MIPKIIHLCWLSGDPYPEDIQKCLDTWKEHLDGYEIMLWDKNRFDVNSTKWTREAFEAKKYAFAADYIRLYALYNYGGIYLDSDVMMYKSFDELLHLPYFIGQDYTGHFEAAVIGAEKGSKWIGEILDYYTDRSFVKEDGSLDTLPLPKIFAKILGEKYQFKKASIDEPYIDDDNIMYVFSRDYFNSRDSMGAKMTPKSFCAHNYAGTWVDKKTDLKSRIKRMIPKSILRQYFNFSHRTYRKKHITKGCIKFID